MYARRHASHDGNVVGVCHGGHGAFCCCVETLLGPAGQVWDVAFLYACGEVCWVEAVDADDDGWAGGEFVGFAVEGDGGVVGGAHY